MALIIIDCVANPELAAMDVNKIAAIMLGRSPHASDLIIELIDPTLAGAAPAASKPLMPPMSPPKPIKRMLKGK